MEEEGELKKVGFFRRLKIAIIDLEKYVIFLTERFSKTIGFAVKASLILAVIMIISMISNIFVRYGSFENYLDKMIPEFTYTEGELSLDGENDLDQEEINAIKEALSIINLSSSDYSKADLINMLNNLPKSSYVLIAILYVIIQFADIIVYWLLVSLILTIFTFILISWSKMKMPFKIMYSISIYASTLTIILTVLYSILNTNFGVYIDIFDYVAMIISYIYIIAIVALLRSEIIKQQIELIKIVQIQKDIKKEMNEKEKEEEPQDKEKDGPKEEKKEENKKDIDKEPNGSEV